MLLFGSAFVYGATGEIGFSQIAAAAAGDDAFLLAGLAMILAGLAFKVSRPRSTCGRRTSTRARRRRSPRSCSRRRRSRRWSWRLGWLVTAFPEESDIWTLRSPSSPCVSLAWGNLAALAQRDLKRLLAYSSISHAGFLLIAVSAASERGTEALLYYLVPYSAMSVGAFAVVAAREREPGQAVTLESLGLAGWSGRCNGVALWVFMLGFAGFR